MAATDGLRKSAGGGGMRTALIAACGLLGVAGAPAHATEVETGVLGYVEPGRVKALEMLVDARQEFLNGNLGTFRFVFDSLTGSSANGSIPSPSPQTFTSPSAGGSYTTPAGKTPLDDTFSDVRLALSSNLTIPWGRLTNANVGLYGSFERDYTSLGANAALSRDLNQKNTTVTLRAARFEDTVSPMGGAPVPLAPMPAPTPRQGDGEGEGGSRGPGKSKNVTDLGLGLTQVLTRRTLLNLNYTNTRVGGYQTDPYKVVAVVDPVTGEPRATNPYLFESRPDRRLKHAMAAELIQNLGRDIITVAYRHYNDDWNVTSNTWDVTYRLNYASDRYFMPHVRLYRQTAADAYRRYLVDGQAAPDFATADYRLGDMHAVTAGLKYGQELDNGHQLTLRLEYYAQMGENHPADAVGALRNYDLFPTVTAWIVNVGYSFGK